MTELSTELGLHKVTALRLLQTLVAEGMVRQDPASRRYHFSRAAWLRGALVLKDLLSLTSAAQAILEELTESTGATSTLSFPERSGRAVVPVMYALPDEPVRVDPGPRPSVPAHTVAAGKCYLASMSQAELSDWLKEGLPKLTEHTITSPERLMEQLAAVREKGYAVSREECILGCCSMAVPLRDDTGATMGAVGLTTVGGRIAESDIRKWFPLLREAADRLSELMRVGLEAKAAGGEQSSRIVASG